MAFAVQNLNPAWNPLNQQSIEPDTTLLLDPDGDTAAGFTPGFGGLCPQSTDDAGPFPAIVAGKFLKGIQPSHTVSTLTLLLDGLVPASEFTIEWWAQCTTGDWSAVGATPILTAGGNNQYVQMSVGSTTSVKIAHLQNPASTSGYTGTAQFTPTSGQYPVSAWVNVAATLKAGVLTLYVNAVQKAQISGVIAPALWSADGYKRSLALGGNAFIISDVRISRKARTPGVPAIIAPSRSVVSVSASTTGATIQKLNGTLHSLVRQPAGNYQAALGGLGVVRTDKLLSCTPIVAGATDATHPTAGHSGSYSYDWQVVDRSLRYISETLGCEPYISLDSTPQILGGGGVAPYTNTPMTTSGAQTPDVSGTLLLTASASGLPTNSGFSYLGNTYAYLSVSGNSLTGVTFVSGTPGLSIPSGATVNVGALTSLMAYQGGFASGPPSSANTAAFATMCADLAYHVLNELALTHPPQYWGLWNEPDGSSFWETGVNAITDYITLYNAVAPAVKAISAAVKFGGPEVAGVASSSWITQLISNCKTNSVALDFVSSHFYSGDASEPAQLAALVTAECAAVGMTPVPPLINGETGVFYSLGGSWPFFQPWSNQGPKSGYAQTGVTSYNLNDYQAGWLAQFLITQQQQGFVRCIYNEVGTTNSTVPAAFFDNNSIPQVSYNVMRLWAMTIGNSVLSTTVTSDPGVLAVASKDASSKVYVFLSCLHYRKTQSYPVLVPVAGVADGTNVTAYVVDDRHSNAYDARTPGGILETVSVPPIRGGNAAIQLRPRSAALLVIG